MSDGLSESEMEYYARQFDVDNHSSSNDETILELENTDEEKGTIELEIEFFFRLVFIFVSIC